MQKEESSPSFPHSAAVWVAVVPSLVFSLTWTRSLVLWTSSGTLTRSLWSWFTLAVAAYLWRGDEWISGVVGVEGDGLWSTLDELLWLVPENQYAERYAFVFMIWRKEYTKLNRKPVERMDTKGSAHPNWKSINRKCWLNVLKYKY